MSHLTSNADRLREARRLISDEGHWTTGVFFRRVNEGRELAFCAVGACRAATEDATGMTVAPGMLTKELQATLNALLPGKDVSVTDYNDTHTHTEVLALFDTTISRLEAQSWL